MNDLAALLSSFDVSPLFPIIKIIADSVAMYLTPVLLLLAINIRLMETQLDGLVSGGKYGAALRDMLVWTFVCGVYFSINSLVLNLFNPIYAWLDNIGSVKSVMAAFATFSAENQKLLDKQSSSFGETLLSAISSPYVLIAAVFYYGSLIMLAFLTTFLKIANVLVFGIAFIWGLIAIPISISSTFKILRGWAYLYAFALVWPVVQGLLLALFSMIFINSVSSLSGSVDNNASVLAANAMMLFSVMHLLMGAVMIAAPFIANALITNSSSAAGIVMPFVGAAVAAGAGTAKVLSGGAGVGGGTPKMPNLGGVSASLNAKSSPTPRFSTQAGSRFTGGDTEGSKPSLGGVGGVGDSAKADASLAPLSTPVQALNTGDDKKRTAQRRRGVILNQKRGLPRK